MTELSDKNWMAASDTALMAFIGTFIKHHRLLQNKTQGQLAEEAGIVRSTLSLFERGENTSMIVFIQLLRALKLLYLLKEFQVKQQLSPIQLAKLEKAERKRAGKGNKQEQKPKTDW
ncbi:MAG: helix-turn-helix transcriptional regulator [Bacteroidetes bacterium]|nr:helix-turn-helix transcriptional regulator [Bacteroidota bacterium]